MREISKRASPQVILAHRLALPLILLGFGLILVGVGIVVATPSGELLRSTVGVIGVTLPFVGIPVLLGGRLLLGNGVPASRGLPATSTKRTAESSRPSVEWIENQEHAKYARRDLLLGRIRLGGVGFFAVATVTFFGLAETWRDAPGSVVGAVIGLWFLALLVFAFGMSFAKKPLSVRAPLRIGVDSWGVRAEYDTNTEKARARRSPPVTREISWGDIREIRGFPFSMGATNGVLFEPKNGDETVLGPITPELASHIMELGRGRGLTVTL